MMLLVVLIGAAFAATQNEARPLEKKILHLKAAAPQMVNMYFVEAVPDANNPAHREGTIKKVERRTRIASRLNEKLVSLADVVTDAVNMECVVISARGSLERFVNGDFKMAARQILKNYLRLRESISTETRICARFYNKLTRKVARYDANLRSKYCEKVYNEEWCSAEYKYTLDKRVEDNPHEKPKSF